MKKAAAGEPRVVVERTRVEHEGVAFPMPNGVTHVLRLARLTLVACAAVGRNHPVLAVAAAAVRVLSVEERHVRRRLVDASRRTLPRDAERLAGHHRIVLVRPLIELDDLVPVLGFVEGTIRTVPGRRLELEIERLVPFRRAAFE